MKTQDFNRIEDELMFRIIGGITDPNIEDDGDEDEDMATGVATPGNSTGSSTTTNPAPRRTR